MDRYPATKVQAGCKPSHTRCLAGQAPGVKCMIGPRNPISQQLHAAKYRQKGETYDDYCVRYARTAADDEHHFRALLQELRTQTILPAGRQQRAVGWPFQTTAFNCFVGGTIADDTKGIGDALTESMLTLRSGGGCGWDFSTLRPSGEPVRGLGDDAYASGPVSFMGMWHAMCNTIRSAGERRGAMMGVLRVDHPDILLFIRAKQNEKSLTNFNISVGITDDFMEAVYADKGFDLKFDGRRIRTVQATALWAVLMENNWDWAEPGVLFLDTINRMNPLRYCEYIAATNPCVPGDTLVLTDSGHRPIANLVGQRVNVWNGDQWSEVVPRQTGTNQKLVRVALSNGASLVCTPAHRFVLADGNRVEAQHLCKGARLPKCKWPVVKGGTDVPLAYTQGFFSGDGWYDKRGRAYIGLYEGKQHLVSKLTHETCHTYDVAGGYEGHNPEYTRTYLKLDASMMQEKDFVPDCTWSVSSRLNWLAGLADSDGYVCKDGSLQISSKDKSFLERVRLLLLTLGTGASIKEGREGQFRLLVSGWYVSKLRDELGFQANRVDVSYQPNRSSENFVTVVSVTSMPKLADVYCFTEESKHQGVFNGVLTGQCGEQPLPPHGACLLLSHNMVKYLVPGYSKDPQGPKAYTIDLEKLERDVSLSVRACDNVFERTVYPLESYKAEALAKRRMGVGVTGMANALEVCGMRYGSAEYLNWQTHILTTIRDAAYRTSIDMAKRKGAFPLFDAEKWLASGFGQTLPDELRHDIRKFGLRNGLLLSIAPTGTISLTADNVSSGIEPPPVLEADRDITFGEGKRTVAFNDYALEEYGVRGRTAMECSPQEHVHVLCEAQKLVDSSISKTANIRGAKTTPALEGEITFEAFKGLYVQAHKGGAKGCTTFNVNGKRAGIIRERVSLGVSLETANAIDDPNAPEAVTAFATENCYMDPATGARVCG